VKALAVLALVALLALAYFGMWRGWQARSRRQSDLPEPEPLGDEASPGADARAVAATYVSSTTAYQWMDRITAHGLGTLSKATVSFVDGSLQIRREGARSFRIPAADLLGVRRERGIAGKVRDRDGIVVVTWQLGGRQLDTGLRPDHADRAADIERGIEQLIEGEVRHG